MMKPIAGVLMLWILLLTGAEAGEPLRSTLLEKEIAVTATRQCSRDSPEHVEDGWTPSPQIIQEMETRIPQLKNLESKACCGKGKIEGKLSDYSLQYAGIVVGGRRLIYINAFPKKLETPEWTSLMVVCDGGKSFWGAVYDPATGTFSQLAFNGEA
ncbi:MAG: hypothetical protein OEV94_00850 [Deltaproteobacteria bacterium]|nr:hypothetical protein [Deltaproteobacteria bacterium]